ncbi:MAG: beta-ketoacyl synthase [Sandaracinaceae bacterium]
MRALTEPLVITGAAVRTHLGGEMRSVLDRLRLGEARPFVRYEEAVDAGCGCTLIGRYEGALDDASLGIQRPAGRFMGRAARMALSAAREAVAQSGVDPRQLGVVVGSGTGDVETHRAIDAHLAERGRARGVGPTTIPRLMASSVSANLATVLGAEGPSVSAAAACAGGAWNLVIAAQLLLAGDAEAVLAGGVEVADLHFHIGFDEMRAYTRRDNDQPERASRPYAADRAGFVFGEGAGLVVLERASSAAERGAEVLGHLHGWGMSSDGSGEMVRPSVGGPQRAIESALRRAGLEAREIGYVNTHATGTAADLIEVDAFADRVNAPYSSTKGYTGHTVSAAGALEAVFTCAMLREGWFAPCVNATPLDPALPRPPVCAPTRGAARWALSHSFGFGGTNVALVLGA